MIQAAQQALQHVEEHGGSPGCCSAAEAAAAQAMVAGCCSLCKHLGLMTKVHMRAAGWPIWGVVADQDDSCSTAAASSSSAPDLPAYM
jgi:hypothetical protein